MRKRKSSLFVGIMAVFILFVFDQATKHFAQSFLAGTRGISVIPGVFELFYLENRGAAFGMFADRQWFFIFVAVLMTAVSAYVYVRLPDDRHYRPLRLICILIAAGALGNMADRLIWNYVIDFLYFSRIDFPVFNVADCYVCVGTAVAVILIFTVYREEKFEFLFPER